MIDAVVFDVGETLVDETESFGRWADWLGVPRHTFAAVLGAVIADGRGHREAFEYFRPGFDLAAERERRAAAGQHDGFSEADLYPDARPCLAALRDAGVWVGVAGNQPASAGGVLRDLRLPADFIGTSGEWGVSKPDPAFFQAIVAAAPCPAERILYVGDRLDYDLRPAQAAGLRSAFIRRGPWGYIWGDHPDIAAIADWRLATLAELPALVISSREAAGRKLG